jgi:branched-chain amino acid transport system ATP-binding protein
VNSHETHLSVENTVLKVEDVSLTFGGTKALTKVNLYQKKGEILAVIGPNGAGKTSLMNCISGFYRPDKGRIYFLNKEITCRKPREIARQGLARTFQNLRLFTGSTVLDNLMTGAHMRLKSSFVFDCIYFGRSRSEEIRLRPQIEDIIRFLELGEVRKTIVGTLPYGVRKRVELGRALAAEPKLIILDEPMAGMNQEEKRQMTRFILGTVNVKKIPVILIEHDMSVIMSLATRIVVLNFGFRIAEGSPEQIRNDPEVIKAYLGEEEEENRGVSNAK